MNGFASQPPSLCMDDCKFSTILRDVVRRGQKALVSLNGHHPDRSAEITKLTGQRRCSPT